MSSLTSREHKKHKRHKRRAPFVPFVFCVPYFLLRAHTGNRVARHFASSTGRSSGGPPAYILAPSKKPATTRCISTFLSPLFSQNQPWTPVLGAVNEPWDSTLPILLSSS